MTSETIAFRADQLIDTDVLTPQNETLGSVHDLVMSPTTGKIAYLVVGRGGLFGLDETYVPVPWKDFKTTKGANLLVLDTTKATMTAAPSLAGGQFATAAARDDQTASVDSYWNSHLTNKASN